MPTMSLYEMKVTGMLKAGANPELVELAKQDFKAMFPDPATPPPGSWVEKFVIGRSTELDYDTTVTDQGWEVPVGSTLKKFSVLQPGSFLNGVAKQNSLDADTKVTSRTVLTQGSVLKEKSELLNSPYTVFCWGVHFDQVPHWELAAGATDPHENGSYSLLTFMTVVGTVRSGALGEHWDKQTAPDELRWFYRYKKDPFFTRLMATLIRFNDTWDGKGLLEERARVRELKWYCGNGSGP